MKGKENKVKRKARAVAPGVVIAAFAAAAVVYGVLIYTEKKLTEKEPERIVAVATEKLNKGSDIYLEGPGKNVEFKSVPESLVPEGASDITDPGRFYAVCEISKGSILTESMLSDKSSAKRRMTSPVLIGFKAEDYYQTAGGKIGKGDKIHIYVEDEEGEVTLRWSDVYVADAFDASGEEIDPKEGGKSVRYNIYLEKKDVEEFYEKMESKSIRVALACN